MMKKWWCPYRTRADSAGSSYGLFLNETADILVHETSFDQFIATKFKEVNYSGNIRLRIRCQNLLWFN